MQGWKIFAHSMGMVVGNLAIAIKITLIPAIIGVAAMVAMVTVMGVSFETFADEAALERLVREQGAGAVLGPFFLFLLILLVVEFWVFVAWHRFVLLEEYPTGWIPAFRTDRILAYFGKALLLGLIAVGMALILSLGAAAIGAIAGQAGAIGKPLKISEAWAATRGTSWALVLVLIIAGVVQFLMQIVATLSMAVFAPLGFVFLLLAMLVMTLVNVSILTTLYGHYIEGRALS